MRIAFLLSLLAFALALPLTAEQGAHSWADHMGKIPFVVGTAKGLAESKFSGKPIMYFFTATW